MKSHFTMDGTTISFILRKIEGNIKHKNFNKNINNKSLSSLLEFCYISDPNSIFENVFKLEPGQSAEIELSKNLINSNHSYKNL